MPEALRCLGRSSSRAPTRRPPSGCTVGPVFVRPERSPGQLRAFMIVGVLLALLPLLLLVKPARGALLTPLLANRDHKPSGPARRV